MADVFLWPSGLDRPHGFMNKKAFSWFGTGLDRLLCFACRLHPRQLSQLPADQSLFASSPGWRTTALPSRVLVPHRNTKTKKRWAKPISFRLVRHKGLEPLTFAFVVRYSIQLS